MVVLVLTACPAGLRGYLTRWLQEISPGVFVGSVSTRVRDKLGGKTVALSQDGRALMVFRTSSEQGYDFRVHHHDWEVIDMDGLKLIRRPTQARSRIPCVRDGVTPRRDAAFDGSKLM